MHSHGGNGIIGVHRREALWQGGRCGGPFGGWNDDSIYSLADFLKSQSIAHIYTSNGILVMSLGFLTGKNVEFKKIPGTMVTGEVEKNSYYPELNASNFIDNVLFITDVRKDNQFLKDFISLAQKNGYYVVKERQFYNRSGFSTYAVYSLGKYINHY